ncbi:3'(2'),5'-bisphosphate nucleotidase 1 [Porphyridium purpureum]|uniref:3'(2'),5'-bisphosphate nucleotidase n=1 Tax=Porphyridium purpureum TaxID=35688 RepID=A0A5J4YNR5_PORPP|nr:3'(2'),5'-bisphosphate nucleotidase 1 [Porphyridium purpureum]|eukprot:POR5216..scf222_8
MGGSSCKSSCGVAYVPSGAQGGALLLVDVVRTCAYLAASAGAVIRDVQRRRDAGDALALGATLKDANDTRSYLTVADLRAQRVIVQGLRERFPWMQHQIVAEEDDAEVDQVVGDWKFTDLGKEFWDQSKAQQMYERDFEAALRSPDALPEEYMHIKQHELAVFIDPVDGTREFFESRLEACMTLIGISWRGRAIAGVVGLPFHDTSIGCVHASKPASARGIVLRGIVGVPQILPSTDEASLREASHSDTEAAKSPASSGQWKTSFASFYRHHADDVLVTATSDYVKKGVMKLVHDRVGGENVLAGGCANKIVRLLTGQADVTIFNLGTSLWDSCALAALLQVAGGKMTTITGFPLLHEKNMPTRNRLGVLATGKHFERRAHISHEKLTQEFHRNLEVTEALFGRFGLLMHPPGESQATDNVRFLDGLPLSKEKLGQMVGVELAGYSCPEREASRYKQCVACRVHLKKLDTTGFGPDSVFLKRAVFAELGPALEKNANPKLRYKVARDARSLAIEHIILGDGQLQEYSKATPGVSIVEPYTMARAVYADSNPIDSRFCMILKDFSPVQGWHQKPFFGERELLAALRFLATFHAFFWQEQGDEKRKHLAEKLWPTGGYVHLGQQPRGQVEALDSNWKKIQSRFQFGTNGVDLNLGARLAQVAYDVSYESHAILRDGSRVNSGWPNARFETLTHGDAKPPNFFFKADTDQLGVIDFQWTGVGLGAVDVAYCIFAGAHKTVMNNVSDPESCVTPYVNYYHATLLQAFQDYGIAANETAAERLLPKNVFQAQFEAGCLDLARVIIGDHWASVTPEILAARNNKLSFNAYNKCSHVAAFLVAYVDVLLTRRGV